MSGTLGIVMLVHASLGRAEQVARHWAAAGCPVVIHVDRNVPKWTAARFQASLEGQKLISFCRRFRCDWGTWSIVQATRHASEEILQRHPSVGHVFLTSGSCLPLRPVEKLVSFLAENSETDFIESVTIRDASWIVDGLGQERFTLRFPFSWRRHRVLFDRCVRLQRALRLHRRVAEGLVPHMGSQWWCLTRRTLSAILKDPERARHDRYFRQVWIPDESYFQTLVRRHSTTIESRSLTLSKFDFQGKPHIFYDDHLPLLERSDRFVARKIWPHANRVYDTFLAAQRGRTVREEPSPVTIDRIFTKAVERRVRGRPGLYMQSRFPADGRGSGITAAEYSVFQGFCELFENFEAWLARATGNRVHGHLFDRDRVGFAGGRTMMTGALSDSVAARDYNPKAFLTNLVWNTRGERQCFQYGPRSVQDVFPVMARDPNAQISVITGAWTLPLFRSERPFAEIRREAADLQRIESVQLEILRSNRTKARVRLWTLAEFVEMPMEPLRRILDEIRPGVSHRLAEAPMMTDLTGFGTFLQKLRNQGLHPSLVGDFSEGAALPDLQSDEPGTCRRAG